MELIRPAHLVVCPHCRLHACIVLADGSRTESISSVSELVDKAFELIDEGRMTEEEGSALADEIAASGLADNPAEALLRVVAYAAMRLDPEVQHQCFDAEGNLRSVSEGTDTLQ